MEVSALLETINRPPTVNDAQLDHAGKPKAIALRISPPLGLRDQRAALERSAAMKAIVFGRHELDSPFRITEDFRRHREDPRDAPGPLLPTHENIGTD